MDTVIYQLVAFLLALEILLLFFSVVIMLYSLAKLISENNNIEGFISYLSLRIGVDTHDSVFWFMFTSTFQGLLLCLIAIDLLILDGSSMETLYHYSFSILGIGIIAGITLYIAIVEQRKKLKNNTKCKKTN